MGIKMPVSIDEHISNVAKKYGVEESLIRAVIKNESGYNPKAMSTAGAMGLMQLMPLTAKELGVKDSSDPYQNVEGGVKYLSQLSKKYKDPMHVIAAYNAGPGNVDKYKGIPPFKETQNYVRKVQADYLKNKPQQEDDPNRIRADSLFTQPAYGEEDKGITIKKKGLDRFDEEDLPNNFNLKPLWERKGKAETAFDEEFGDVYAKLTPKNKKIIDEQVKSPFVKHFAPDDAGSQMEDIGRGLRVTGESFLREVPRSLEATQNTARAIEREVRKIIPTTSPLDLLHGESNEPVIPKANYVEQSKGVIPSIASDEEIQARTARGPGGLPLSLETFTGAALPYVGTGIAGGIAKATGAVSKIAPGLRTAAQIASPLVPATGAIKNIGQGIASGVESAISETEKQDKPINVGEVLKTGGVSGIATALPVIAGKGIGAGINAGKMGLVKKLAAKAGVENVEPGKVSSLAQERLAKVAGKASLEAPPQKVIKPDLETTQPSTIKTITKPPIEDVSNLEKQHNVTVDAYELDPNTISTIQANRGTKKLAITVSQSAVNKRANELIETNSSRGVPYKDILNDDVNYAPEAQKYYYDELLQKAKAQAAQEIASNRKNYNYDNVDTVTRTDIDEGLRKISDLEYQQQQIMKRYFEPESKLLKEEIELTKKDLTESGVSGSPRTKLRKTQEAIDLEKENLKAAEEKAFKIKEEKLKKITPEKTNLITENNVKRKLGIKEFIKGEEGSLDVQSPLKGALKIKEVTKDFFHEPLRVLEQKGYKYLVEPVRKKMARAARFYGQIERPFLLALSEIPVTKEEYASIAKLLDAEDSANLINTTNIQSPIWNELSDNGKAWASLYAEFFQNAADILGIPQQKRIGQYVPYMKDIDPELDNMMPKNRTTGDPGFTYERVDGSVGTAAAEKNLPLIAMRYANGVRRKILTEIIGDSSKDFKEDKKLDTAYKTAFKKATESGDQEALNALTTLRRNLENVYDPNNVDKFIGEGLKNFVENTLRFNASSALLNSSQTIQLLVPEVGFKTYWDSIVLLFDPSIQKVLNYLDLDQTSGAKYDLHQKFHQGEISLEKGSEQAFKDFAKDAKQRIMLDPFGGVERYLNQPLAIISGMIRKAGGKDALLKQLGDIDAALKNPGAEIRITANEALDGLVAEGQKLNQRVNFVRLQGDRPNYETASFSRYVLPLINYPIKEAGWVADTVYNFIKKPEGSPARLDSLRALGTYLGVKTLIAGPKGAATLLIPKAASIAFQNIAPEKYAQIEDKLTEFDDKYYFLRNTTGLDYSNSVGFLDITDSKNINSPFVVAAKYAIEGAPTILDGDKTLGEKVIAGGRLAKFLIPTPRIPIGDKAVLPAGIGQIVEGYRGVRNTQKGSRKVGKSEVPTSGKEEILRGLGPVKEDVSVFKEPGYREAAKRLSRKGVPPSNTQVREITRATKGDELAEDADSQTDTLDSIRTGAAKKVKKLFDRAVEEDDDKKYNKYYDELLNLGFTSREIKKHERKVQVLKRGNAKATRRKERRVRSLTR